MTKNDLIAFVAAQDCVYGQVIAELTQGRKQTHWMWFIFPQLAGLGQSAMARRFAIQDIDHARRYLENPILGARLREGVRLILTNAGKSALDIFGSTDDAKLRSCLSLFLSAAPQKVDQALFQKALDQFYGGKLDPRTLELLRC